MAHFDVLVCSNRAKPSFLSHLIARSLYTRTGMHRFAWSRADRCTDFDVSEIAASSMIAVQSTSIRFARSILT
jgi:hypothetical protein